MKLIHTEGKVGPALVVVLLAWSLLVAGCSGATGGIIEQVDSNANPPEASEADSVTTDSAEPGVAVTEPAETQEVDADAGGAAATAVDESNDATETEDRATQDQATQDPATEDQATEDQETEDQAVEDEPVDEAAVEEFSEAIVAEFADADADADVAACYSEVFASLGVADFAGLVAVSETLDPTAQAAIDACAAIISGVAAD